MTWFQGSREGIDDVQLEAETVQLHELHPKASLSECRRFLNSFGPTCGTASKHLQAYLEWKEAHGLFSEEDEDAGTAAASTTALAKQPETAANEFEVELEPPDETKASSFVESDAADWDRAIRAAHKFHYDRLSCTDEEEEEEDEEEEHIPPSPDAGEGESPPSGNDDKIMNTDKSSNSATSTSTMPPLQPCQVQQIAALVLEDDNRDDAMRDCDGNRVFYVMPARMNLQKVSKEVYTTAFALYVYRKLQKFAAADDNEDDDSNNSDTAKYTIAVDTRPAPGWPNVLVHHMLGMIRYTVNTLHRLFPDLIARILLFPVPAIAVRIYDYIAQPFLHADICRTLHMCAGEAGRASPLPPLAPHLSPRQCERLDEIRFRAFGK